MGVKRLVCKFFFLYMNCNVILSLYWVGDDCYGCGCYDDCWGGYGDWCYDDCCDYYGLGSSRYDDWDGGYR